MHNTNVFSEEEILQMNTYFISKQIIELNQSY